MKYLLYIGPLQNIPDGVEYSYYDSGRERMFVLADQKPKTGRFVPVPDELLSKLGPDERRWYDESCFRINQKWLREHPYEAAASANELLDRFEEELRAEAEKLKENGNGEQETAE